MSILNRMKQQQGVENAEFDLSKQDIEMLLTLIKDSTFKGEHVETLYGLVYKLQQQYLQKK
jgi:hypothetical protein